MSGFIKSLARLTPTGLVTNGAVDAAMAAESKIKDAPERGPVRRATTSGAALRFAPKSPPKALIRKPVPAKSSRAGLPPSYSTIDDDEGLSQKEGGEIGHDEAGMKASDDSEANETDSVTASASDASSDVDSESSVAATPGEPVSLPGLDHDIAGILAQHISGLSQEKTATIAAAIASAVAEGLPSKAPSTAGDGAVDSNFDQQRDHYREQSEAMLNQQLQMQNIQLKISQRMEIIKIIGELCKKAIENYSIR